MKIPDNGNFETQEVPPFKSLGRYKLLSPLGTGGMGEVFLAEDTQLRRKVALKILPEDVASDINRLRRFEQEAQAASALNHPNILTIYEFGVHEGVHFLATENVEGETLRQRLKTNRPSLLETLTIAEQIAFGLSAAHCSGIVHRDLKPENVMIRNDGIVKVLDFGLAKLLKREELVADPEAVTKGIVKTTPGIVMGTVAYMSPEQARGQDADERTDIWSLGVVLFEMICGKLPFPGETTSDVIASILTREPRSLSEYVSDLPSKLEDTVHKCLQKKREDRFQKMDDCYLRLKELRQEVEFDAKHQRATAANPEDRPTQLLQSRDTANKSSSGESLLGRVRKHKTASVAGLLILVLGIAGTIYWRQTNRPSSKNQIDSLAVLPFENASGNSDMEYLSDGITEALINSLTQVPNTKVIARASVFRYKGKQTDVSQIGRELSVSAIVTGRVVQRGDTLSINVDLMDVKNNTQLWGEQFTRKSSDVFALQDDIARKVTESLRVHLTGTQQERIAKRYTSNEEAYKLYLRGRYYLNRRTIDDFKLAIPYFQKAIQLDSSFALAYSGWSDSLTLLTQYGGKRPEDSTLNAKDIALKALSLDDNLAEAHGSLSQHLVLEYDFGGAERELKRAIELNPNYASAYQWYAELLYWTGRFDEAQAQAKRAVELDPLSRIINSVYARSFLFARKYDEAIAAFKKNIELNSDWFGDYEYLFHAYAAKGMYAEAVSAYVNYMKLANLAPPDEIVATQDSFNRAGWQGFLRHRIKYLEEHGLQKSAPLAQLYAYAGDKDKTIALLQRDPNLRGLVETKYLCAFDNLRGDARFEEILKRIGFPE